MNSIEPVKQTPVFFGAVGSSDGKEGGSDGKEGSSDCISPFAKDDKLVIEQFEF